MIFSETCRKRVVETQERHYNFVRFGMHNKFDQEEKRTPSLEGLKICYFGHYKPDYSRNRIIIKALGRAGAKVVEINDRSHGIIRYPKLFFKSIEQEFDVMIVGFIGHTDIPLARLVCTLKRAPLIFDAFLSLYDTNVTDRRLSSPKSLSGRKWYFIDKTACRLADAILLDTHAHILYFKETFGIDQKKFYRVWLGADDDVMSDSRDEVEKSEFVVFFYGSFIPLHGIEHIIEAARILEERGETVRFVLVGGGQTYPEIRKTVADQGIQNVHFIGRIPYEGLPQHIRQSDLCLGIFGTTPKANRVIPNKVFDALALGRCVITAETSALGEALTHGENIWFCKPGSGESLAEAITTLKKDRELRESIGRKGYQLFKETFSIEALSKDLAVVVRNVLGTKKARRL